MLYALLADLVLVIHLLFILFAVFGGLLLFWRPWCWVLHLPAFTWAVWIEWSAGLCPLTPWEVLLRRQAGQAGYEGGFIDHYLLPLIYPAGLTPEFQWVLGSLVLIVNLGIYGWYLRCNLRG